ncbi:MAG TPA: hypothetical protein VJK54_00570, partial [Chthoniobacterales bacterium]|nr:hypothetical protein [Chthoniobacterales bacterium]
LKNYQNPEFQQAAVEQEEIGEAIMALKDQLEEAYQSSFITYRNEEALNHYKELAFKRALENARNHPEEMAEAWDKIAATQKGMTASQQEINKEAATVFKEEVKRLEKIEKIWQGILEREQEEAKQKSEQAAQKYYRGNLTDWHALSDQERERYNNDVRKANEEYEQKSEEQQALLPLLEIELQKTGKLLEVVKTKRKGDWRASSAQRHDQQIIDLGAQQEKLLKDQKKLQEDLAQQATALRFGKKATQKENYYQALKQAQSSEGKAKEGKNPYWEKAAECYRHASSYWKEAADDKTSGLQQAQKEKVASFYGRAAEAYEKAAQEQTALATTRNRSKETLIQLYREEAILREQLAEQWGKGESTSNESNIADIQEALYQLEKKIERYLGTRGAQIEELQENLPQLERRLEEVSKEVVTLRQQGKEVFALNKETLVAAQQEIIASCKKSLEELLQEVPESGERAATLLSSMQAHKIKDQQLQQSIERTLQLDAKVLPLEQRAALLPSEIIAAQGRGELFFNKGQHQLTAQLNQTLEQAKNVHEKLVSQSERTEDMATQFQLCMSMLQQVEEQDRYLQRMMPQLQQLDESKTLFATRVGDLRNSIKIAQSEGETFLIQGQEKLLSDATKLFSEIDSIAEQLLAKAEKSSERASDLLLRGARFQQDDKALQENSLSLREFGQKKNSLQKHIEVLTRDIALSQSRGEALLGEGQQQLLHDTTQVLSGIEQVSKKILAGDSDASEQGIALRSQLKQIEERDQALKKNAPTLLALEQKKNAFQVRLKQLTAEISTSKNKTYLSEAQESLAREITQLLSKIDQNTKQLLANASEASAEAKTLLTQLEQLDQRDQQLQRVAPDLGKLDEKKSFFQGRLEALATELKSAQNQQCYLVIEKQRGLVSEITQALAKIEQTAKQFLSHASSAAEETSQLLSQLDLLAQREQRLQQHFTQLRDLTQKESHLKTRVETLENEIITSQIRKEITLAQAQETLFKEISKILQEVSQAAKQLLEEDETASQAASLRIKELIAHLDQLSLRDQRLQDNAFALRDLEQKKKLLHQRMETLKAEIVSSEKAGEPLLEKQQQTLLEILQQALDKASDTTTQLMAGAEHASEQAKAFFNE